MPASRPSSLPENARLAFIGEPAWPAARLTAREAKLLASAQNPSGRPNDDVLRNFIGLVAGMATEQPQIDFPLYFTEQEAALYREPFNKLRAAQKIGGSTVGASLLATSHTPSREQVRSHPILPAALILPSWWISPHSNSELRTALARLERYLVTPVNTAIPAWTWIDSHTLPDATLLAVARDDDFTSGILRSRIFQCWWHQYSSQLTRIEIVSSFPFPWPPTTLLSALNRTQEEQRHALARAARSENQEQINSTVSAACGWSLDLTDDKILAELIKLNHQRAIAADPSQKNE